MIVLFSAAASAQLRNKPYTLLWRISGKDLKEPSYLFGTMHVQDKRVFGFSDSVMLAIQKCQSFALEVHPDSTTRALFELFSKSDSTFDLHKLLSDAEYQKFAKKFEARNGYKLREGMNPLLAETMMEGRNDKPDDKESFVDAYLYGIARTMHKNIYGLENIPNHLSMFFGGPEKTKERLLSFLENSVAGEDDSEEMIRIYSTGNLDNILSYINKFGAIDSQMVARNKVMASGIIRYSHQAPIFVAIGTAHLPGDDGVIALLRKEGYTVDPVNATFTGVPSKFHIDYNSMTWVTHKDDGQGYSLDFPAEPIQTNIYSSPTLMYPDLATGTFYGIYVVREGTSSYPADHRKVFDRIIHNLTRRKNDVILSRKDIIKNGMPGMDIVTKGNHQYQRSVMFVNHNMLYYLYMGSHLNNLHSDYANRFFNSLKTFNIPEKAPANWIDFKHDTAAFSIRLPSQPQRITKYIADPKTPNVNIRLNLLLVVDTDQMNTYLIRYNDYPQGNYMANKQALFDNLSEQFSAKSKVVGKPKTIWLDGYEGRELKLIFSTGDPGLLRLFVRGNRTYLLLEQNARKGEGVNGNDAFFNSFSFTPYMKPDYVNYESKTEQFKVKLFTKPKIDSDSVKNYSASLQNMVFTTSTSPASGGTYSIEHYTIGKYYRVKDIDSLYNLLDQRLVSYNDTLIKTDTVLLNGRKAREVIIEKKDTKDQSRARVLIDGGDVFYLKSHAAKKELFNDEGNTFFNSFERIGEVPKFDLPSSKAKLIADDLHSNDTTVYARAKDGLDYYKFEKDELPEIYRALEQKYPDDTSSNGVRCKLLEKISMVHDEGTLGHLQSLFANLKDKDMIRSTILSTIPRVDSLNGYDAYFKLLTETKPLKAENNYTTFKPLYDSLEYAATHYKQLMPLAADSTYKDNIIAISSRMVSQDKPEYNNLVKENFSVLTSNAYDELVKYTASTDTNKNEYNINTYKYLNIMSVVKGEPLTDKYTQYYIGHYPNGYFLSDAVTTRISNHLPVNPKLVIRLLDSLDTRYEVMEAYHKEKQMDKVALKYKTPAEFGRLCLRKVIEADNDNDDDENNFGEAEKLTLLGSVMDKGSVYYAYKFKQSGRDSVASFIGIAGPYKPGSSELNFKRYYAYTDYTILKSAMWIKEAKALIPKLRESYDLDKKEDNKTGKLVAGKNSSAEK